MTLPSLIWSWLFPPRRPRAKASGDPAVEARQPEADLPARIVRPVDGSPVAPFVVADAGPPPPDVNAAAAAAAVGAALLYAADMAMHGQSLDIGQPTPPPAPDPGAASPPGSDASAPPPSTGGDAGSSDGGGQSGNQSGGDGGNSGAS